MRHTSARITDMQHWREVHPQAAVSLCRRDIEGEVSQSCRWRPAVLGRLRVLPESGSLASRPSR
jgi:hypothetical protein